MSFDGKNVVILDLETLQSAADLPTGWNDKRALGLSIGGFYDYQDGRVHWFDRRTLLRTVETLVARQPLLVSFNGIQFDFALMRALLRHGYDATIDVWSYPEVCTLCDRFKALAGSSYDLLAEVWQVDAVGKTVRGLNSLEALCAANGVGVKTGSGALAPKLWQAGQIAEVINYCQNDIYLTKGLLELVARQKGLLMRRTGPLQIRHVCTVRQEECPPIVMHCPAQAPTPQEGRTP